MGCIRFYRVLLGFIGWNEWHGVCVSWRVAGARPRGGGRPSAFGSSDFGWRPSSKDSTVDAIEDAPGRQGRLRRRQHHSVFLPSRLVSDGRSYRVLLALGPTLDGSYRVFTEFFFLYRLLRTWNGSSWAIPGYNGLYWVVLGCKGGYRVFTGFLLAFKLGQPGNGSEKSRRRHETERKTSAETKKATP